VTNRLSPSLCNAPSAHLTGALTQLHSAARSTTATLARAFATDVPFRKFAFPVAAVAAAAATDVDRFRASMSLRAADAECVDCAEGCGT
jgi:hypothetical protein